MRASSGREDEQIIFVRWFEFIEWLLNATMKFPQKARFTFAQRIDNLALDLVEDLIESRYTLEKRAILKRANLKLEKLRVLIRLSHKLKYLPHNGYEYASKAIDEVGRMLGGWIKQQTRDKS